MRVLHVSVVFTMESSENDRHTCKKKWRGRRGVNLRRDAPTVKKEKVIGRQIWTSFSVNVLFCVATSFVWLLRVDVQKQIRAIHTMME